MGRTVTAEDILSAYRRRHEHGWQYLVLEAGYVARLGKEHITGGTPKPYSRVTTVVGAETQILLDLQAIADGQIPDALDGDGSLRPEAAHAMAQTINDEAGLTRAAEAAEAREAAERAREAAEKAAAVAKVHEVTEQAEVISRGVTAAAEYRAAAIARVVELYDGNQAAAARALDMDHSTVSKLLKKQLARTTEAATATAEALRKLEATAAAAADALATILATAVGGVQEDHFDEPEELEGITPEPALTPTTPGGKGL